MDEISPVIPGQGQQFQGHEEFQGGAKKRFFKAK